MCSAELMSSAFIDLRFKHVKDLLTSGCGYQAGLYSTDTYFQATCSWAEVTVAFCFALVLVQQNVAICDLPWVPYLGERG